MLSSTIDTSVAHLHNAFADINALVMSQSLQPAFLIKVAKRIDIVVVIVISILASLFGTQCRYLKVYRKSINTKSWIKTSFKVLLKSRARNAVR